MAHYAFIDKNNIVVEVIVGRNEHEIVDGISDWEEYYTEQRSGLKALRTSYNTANGKHKLGGVAFRGNYASIGYRYDQNLDAFIPPKPYESWILDKETFDWKAPIPAPDNEKSYSWNEKSKKWEGRS